MFSGVQRPLFCFLVFLLFGVYLASARPLVAGPTFLSIPLTFPVRGIVPSEAINYVHGSIVGPLSLNLRALGCN